MHDITCGLAHIHRHRELHRDIKPRNGLHTSLLVQANILVLLSVLDNSWKISDFGLTSEGTSRFAYTTQFARGTECYRAWVRAPELMKEVGCVTQSSDVWALGCIFYELVFKIRAFRSDFHVFNYINSKRVPTIHSFSGSKRIRSYIKEFIYRMLEINWWERPSTSDILAALESVSNQTSTILLCDTELEVSVSKLGRVDGSGAQSTTLASNITNRPQESEGPEEALPPSSQMTSLRDEDERWETMRWTLCW
jgi:serine/threonine protein kinase